MFYFLELLADWLVYRLFGLIEGSHLGDAVNFFILEKPMIYLFHLYQIPL